MSEKKKRGPKPKHPKDRFMAKVKKRGKCWIWTGGWGHGAFRMEGMSGRHKGGWKASPTVAAVCLFRGAEPRQGYSWFPTCGNELCVNPEHLEERPVQRSPKTYDDDWYPCGHERTAENTYVMGNRKNCRVCHKERVLDWRRRNPERTREIQRKSSARYYAKQKRLRESSQ